MRIVLLSLVCIFLTSCIYFPAKREGFIFSSEQISSIKPNISRRQVYSILGNPFNISTNNDRVIYYYLISDDEQKLLHDIKKINKAFLPTHRLVIIFQNDFVTSVNNEILK